MSIFVGSIILWQTILLHLVCYTILYLLTTYMSFAWKLKLKYSVNLEGTIISLFPEKLD